MAANMEFFQALLAKMRAEFIGELPERCNNLDDLILTLEKFPQDSDAFDALYRGVHSLKGSGGTHDLSIITTICHQFENLLTEAASEKDFGASFASRALDFVDWLRKETIKGALVKTGGTAAAVQHQEDAQYLTFLLGGEMFAIGILGIKEIIEYASLTAVPMMPRFIRGVINLRGVVMPVVDLSARFGRKSSEITRRSCIVILEVESDGEVQDVGVVVDSVSEVLAIAASQIEPPPSFGTKIRADFISGMGKVNGKFVIILNADRVLSVDEMAMLVQTAD